MSVLHPIFSRYSKSMDARSRKVVKFVISGGCAAATEFLVFFILHYVGLWLLGSHVISFLCGLGISFTLNKQWVFSKRGQGVSQFIAYVMLAIVNLVVGSGLLMLLTDVLDLPALISKLSVMASIAIWNFVIYERIIFRQKPNEPSANSSAN